ncbi:uncharacterized protein LOC116291518 [Actinia tenebrosa]|uniref:Uncharacterized protein LOC116291518 n=1 Tax=Actinia tenebrosa TaxID=6105 RepID=A0A6P8HDQ0_ACTTE|nr:uncharacterized protein LOC116291518 [Actinia tenebrosa]
MNAIRLCKGNTGILFRQFKRYSASTLFGRQFKADGGCDFVNIPKQNARHEKISLLEFVKNFEEKSLKEPDVHHDIPKSWTKANRRGGVSSILQNSRPQILGSTRQQIEGRLSLLESVGITGKDALLIATELPSHFELPVSNFRVIGALLNSLGCNLPKLIIKAPYIFGLDSKALETNVQHLQSIGIPNKVIGQAVDINPLIIIYPLSDHASRTIQLLLSSCEFDEGNAADGHFSDFRKVDRNEFALRLLRQPFDGIREQGFLGENFKQVAKFLYEIQVSPCLMVLNNPRFFQADIEQLHQALEFFTGRPLLFETELIQKMMVSKSEVFLHFERKVFEERLELLKGILKTPRQLYLLLQKYFFFQGEEMNLEHNIEILKKYNFQNEQIANILTSKDFFVSQENDIEAKVKLLLSVEGITVDQIADNSFCLLKSLTSLQNRIKFATEVKPEILTDLNMEMIFATEDEEFITLICKSTVEKYQELTGEEVSTKKIPAMQQKRRKKNVT